MKVSIQVKLLALCIFLVLLTAVSVSIAYYTQAKADKHRESQQRIEVAFGIIIDDLTQQLQHNVHRFEEFIQQDSSLKWLTYFYAQDKEEIGSLPFIYSSLSKSTKELKHFGEITAVDRLQLYGEDKRLLASYHQENALKNIGAYVISASGKDSYLAMDDFAIITKMHQKDLPIQDTPLPEGLSALYEGEIPDTIFTEQFSEQQKLGLQVLAPLSRNEKKIGIIVGETYYSQNMADRYASLSQTEVNLFAGNQWSIGTLPSQAEIETDAFEKLMACDALFQEETDIDVVPMIFEEQHYYQGQCAFKNADGTPIGAITVSLSQEVEQQEIAKLLRLVLVVAGLVSLFAVIFSLFVSRKSIRFIQQLIRYIDRIAQGDIPDKITSRYKGEFQEIQRNMNSLIDAMNKAIHVAEKIANGDLSVTVQKRSEKDALMQALQIMLKSLREVTQVAGEIAEGNLTLDVNTRSQEDRLMQALSTMVMKLNNIVLDAKITADHIAIGSRQLRSIADYVSQGSSQQAAAAEEASSSMEQMVANIRQNADNAKVTEAIALKSASDALQGGKAVKETIDAMKKIEERISVIQEISMQTNILSMNATIEAAKAQDYGKGFAVVASEVRSLAGRSRVAAEEIEQLVKSCVAVSEQAGIVLERLVPNSKKTADLVQEINAAGSEQYMGAEQVNNAIQLLDQVIQQNASSAEEMASSAEESTTKVELLRESMTFFTVKDRAEEQDSEEVSDLMQALQTQLTAKGASEEVLMAMTMLKTMMASSKDSTQARQDSAQAESDSTPPAGSSKDTPEQGSTPEHAEQPDGYEVEMSVYSPKSAKDERDDEFERF